MSIRRFVFAACCTLGLFTSARAEPPREISLSGLDLSVIRQTWGNPHANRSVIGHPLRIGGMNFTNGIGTHANSEFHLDLKRKAARFIASVGLDDDSKDPMGMGKPSIRFIIIGDGKTLWQSPVMILGREPRTLDLDVSGVRFLSLLVVMANDLDHWEHADWADAKLVMQDDTNPECLTDLPKENEVTVTQLFRATAKKDRPTVPKP